MPRTMIKIDSPDISLKVDTHYMTINRWEFYLEKPDENNNSFGLTMGDFDELGYTSIDEIRPFLISKSKPSDLKTLAPAIGWKWKD